MIFVKKWYFYVLLNIKLASCIYFTMSDVEGIIPIITGVSVHGQILSFYAAGNGNVTYSITKNNTSDDLRINKNTGDLYFSSSDVHSVSTEVIAHDYINDTSSSKLKITTIPVISCTDDVLKNICFWSKVTYQIKRTGRRTYLGTLAPNSYLGGCPIKNISYMLLTGADYLKLHPPDNKTKFWILVTNENILENVYDSNLYFNISCTLETSETKMIYVKQIKLNVLDTDFGPLTPQDENLKISMNALKIKKGDIIGNNIIFLDHRPIHESSYYAFINDTDVSDFLKPNCTNYVDSRHRKNRTAIHCVLLVTKSKTFTNDLTFLLGLKSINSNYQGNSNTGYVNITLSFGNNHNKRSSNYFKAENKIFRTAAPYARVTQPYSHMKNMLNYNIKIINFTNNPLRITNEGIVYVYNFTALRNSPEFLSLNITWSQNNITQYEKITVRVVDEPTKTCVSVNELDDWTFCSKFENHKNCIKKDACALGTGGASSAVNRNKPQRCMWRGDKKPDNHETHMYSTCTADIKYCPDGICDSLEALREEELCPQDCSTNSVFPTKLNQKTSRGIDKCNGVLVCDMQCSCYARNYSETSVAQIQENKLAVDTKCDLKCIMGTVGGIIVLISVVFFSLIIWRIKHVKKLTKEKYIQNIQEVETPFSDYIDRNIISEPLVLNFNMTTMFDNTNSNCNTLKTNEIDLKWEFPRNQICIEQILGEGEFGKVLKAKAFNIAGRPGYSLVAVKTLKDDARKQDYNDLFSEYQLLKEVNHPHVIQLLGVCSADDGPLYVIIEYARFGSLRNYLRRSRHILTNTEATNMEENLVHKITPRDILSFARQISSGMTYLSDIKLVHRDLAARNILLAENKICKVSDFGLTRDIYEDNAYFKKSKGRVPVKWMAPESLADHVYTTKSDVWSFGILIWELVTLGASPYPGIPVHNLYNLLKEGYRMEKPTNCSSVLYSLMSRCWNIDPEERPSFLDLYHCFDGLLTDNVNYLDLSDNAIINKSYFSMEAETGNLMPSSTNINFLENYPLHKESLENKYITCNIKENKSCLGYETPVKNPRRISTPTNEMPEDYTDMNFKEEL